MQGTPAGFPFGIPGMGEEMEGAIQQAPHFSRHFILRFCNMYKLQTSSEGYYFLVFLG
jgi:hypothetical protein